MLFERRQLNIAQRPLDFDVYADATVLGNRDQALASGMG